MDSKGKVSQVVDNNPQGNRLKGRPRNGCWNCSQILINAKLKTGNGPHWEKSIKEVKLQIGLQHHLGRGGGGRRRRRRRRRRL